ncbi:hypothetical protein G3I60_20155 [Streptomyces sp. SID13666]|uniref:hypothetical protein n=1 Tax=Streptomyces sp. SID13666 TaxID=2706054 RepID=UPI0013C18992|nr:hypothetical protein [Streptomyces sp. SID13666]NEA56395.1 hypothetical protein [Streptomyces sp. SID13666]
MTKAFRVITAARPANPAIAASFVELWAKARPPNQAATTQRIAIMMCSQKRIFTTFSFNKEPYAVGGGFYLLQANGVTAKYIFAILN